jgi:hypothetical protein
MWVSWKVSLKLSPGTQWATLHTYMPLKFYPRRGSRRISDIPSRHPRFTKLFIIHSIELHYSLSRWRAIGEAYVQQWTVVGWWWWWFIVNWWYTKADPDCAEDKVCGIKWVLTANAARTNGLMCLPKHGEDRFIWSLWNYLTLNKL